MKKWFKARKQQPKRLLLLSLLGIVSAAGLIFFFFYVLIDLPSPTRLSQPIYPVSTQIFDRQGKLLYEIYSEQNRTPIKLSDLPEYLKRATISIEDKDFYHHRGLDIRGIARATYNIVLKKNLQGGSTLTQQLVKTALLSPERTFRRKIREALLAFVTEIIYSKDEILQMYFNFVPYGGTAYGIEQASKLYFDKSAKDLNLAEATLLAGLPQAPTRFSPFGANPKLAKSRQEQVLERMVEDGYITSQEAEKNKQQELKYTTQTTNISAPHFVMYVKDLLVERYGQRMVEQGGLRVITSLDSQIQEFAQTTVASEVAKLNPLHVSNGAALITKPSTGEILAMIGSRDYFDESIDGNVNLTTSLRQPGSSIKPINYAVGLIKGYTPATLFLDIPTCFSIPNQPLYCPHNYDAKFHGPVQMRYALANSYNIPAVKMLALNGVEAMIATASAMGISTWQDPSRYGLSLTLGGGEVKMVDMAVAFGVFANQGKKINLNPILKVEDFQGKIHEENDVTNHPPVGEKVLAEEVSFLISNILSDNGARTSAFGVGSQLEIPGKTVSVKTGTTDDLRDNWTIGYTPSFLISAWVGNNDNTPMHPYLVSGITGAAPIWHKLTAYVLKDQPDQTPVKPQTIISRQVCLYQTSNQSQSPDCQGRFEYFSPLALPNSHPNSQTDTNLQGGMSVKQIWIDKETNRPPEPGKIDNLELREQLVASDAFVKEYCLNCPHDSERPMTISYP